MNKDGKILFEELEKNVQKYLKNESLEKYIGGQAEIKNLGEGYLFRGRIERITIDNRELKIKFEWLAKKRDHYSSSQKWFITNLTEYVVGYEIYSQCKNVGKNRLSLGSAIASDKIILFPPEDILILSLGCISL